MKDRVLIGFISGILAAMGADIINWVLYCLNYTDMRFLDWAAVVFLGHLATNLMEVIVMQITQMIWDGVMGIVFIMIIPAIKSYGLVMKGVIFAFVLLFIFKGATVLFDLPDLKIISLETFLSNVFCTIIWGILVALIIKRFKAL
ncbi:hypothetical protein [Candidatus Formimonas warabiya]|uniref:Uncharacterized protein n=1 Tax=Formimonas warabiya TaxID=1761012 RepID=A0A3G1KY95_FORW1|nr:hypothetical protein [Candidatus Formimonas warabiya]ATW27448.1 hypothetical protein DCMF_24265 [Candidatus Formimonas warabiya]